MTLDNKITVSNLHGSPSDPKFQRRMVLHALEMLLANPYDENLDLRGRRFTVTLHPNGLHATAELHEGISFSYLEDLRRRFQHDDIRYIRPIEDVNLPPLPGDEGV